MKVYNYKQISRVKQLKFYKSLIQNYINKKKY